MTAPPPPIPSINAPPTPPVASAPFIPFLSLYPHPAFTISASTISAALSNRQTGGTNSNPGGGESNRGPLRSSGIVKEGSSTDWDQTIMGGSTNASEVGGGGIGGGTLGGVGSGEGGKTVNHHNHSNKVGTSGSVGATPSHSTLLEGGSQANHDPSRTAEGAVAALMAHREARDQASLVARTAKAEAEKEDARQDTKAGTTDSTTTPEPKDQLQKPPTSTTMTEGKNMSTAESLATDTWSGSTRPMGGTRGEEGLGRGISELVEPCWSNSRWKDLVRSKDELSLDDKKEIGLVDLISRSDLQRLLSLFVEAVSPSGDTSGSDHTLTLSIRFPVNSAHYVPSSRKNKKANNLKQDSSSQGDSVSSNESPNNAYNSLSGGSNKRPIKNRATLQLVAVHSPLEDLIVVTTILTEAHSSPIIVPTTSATPPSSFGGRPPLKSQNSSLSSISTGSSVSTVIAPTPTKHRSFNSTTSTLTPGVPSTPPIEPLPTDKLPAPMADYTGAPTYLEAHVDTTLPHRSILEEELAKQGAFKPSEFALEKKRRKIKAAKERLEGVDERIKEGGERELTFEEEKKEGREGRERRAKAALEEEEELERKEAREVDEELDRELDALRDKTRSGSVNSGTGRLEDLEEDEEEDEEEEEENGEEGDTTDSDVRRDQTLSVDSHRTFLEVISHTPCGRLIARHPWQKTSLGKISSWSRELKSMVRSFPHSFRSRVGSFAFASC